jgi:hypothetical protein
MTSTATARIGRDQPPGRSDTGERQGEERPRTAYRAATRSGRAKARTTRPSSVKIAVRRRIP